MLKNTFIKDVATSSLQVTTLANEIREINSIVSTEGVFVDKINTFVISRLKKMAIIIDTIATSFSNITMYGASAAHSVDLMGKPYVEKIVAGKRYSDVYKRKVAVPIGLKCTLPNAVAIVGKNIKILDGSAEPAIRELSDLMSELMFDSESRVSFKKRGLGIFTDKLLKQLRDDLAAILDPADYSDIRFIEEVIPNLSCLVTIQDNLQVALSKIPVKTMRDIDSQTKIMREKIEIFAEHVDEKSGNIKMSKQALEDLITTIETLANGISLSMSFYALTMQLGTTFNGVMSAIREN